MRRTFASLCAALALALLGGLGHAEVAAQTVPLVRYQTPEGMTAFAAPPAHRGPFEAHPGA